MFLKIMIGAALVAAASAVACCMLSSRISRIEEAEFPCYGCFWESHCSNKDGLKLCEDGHNGWEDAPWEMV